MTLSTISRKIVKMIIPPAFWLGVWQLAAMTVDKQLLLPAPAVVLSTLRGLVILPVFWQTAFTSLLRIFSGLIAGIVLGTLLAVLTTRFYWCDLLLSPAVRVVRATPVASFIILVLLWVESGRVPGVMSALMVLPVIWGNVSAGIRNTDPLLLELCSAYRFGAGKRLRLLYIPSVLPHFASGCNTSLGLAWKAGVAAEVLCLPKTAIGTQVFYSKLYLEIPALFAWTLVVIILSFLVEWGVGWIFRRLGNGGEYSDKPQSYHSDTREQTGAERPFYGTAARGSHHSDRAVRKWENNAAARALRPSEAGIRNRHRNRSL